MANRDVLPGAVHVLRLGFMRFNGNTINAEMNLQQSGGTDSAVCFEGGFGDALKGGLDLMLSKLASLKGMKMHDNDSSRICQKHTAVQIYETTSSGSVGVCQRKTKHPRSVFPNLFCLKTISENPEALHQRQTGNVFI